MKSKTKISLLILSISIFVLIGAKYFLNGASSKEITVTIIDYGSSVCTQDIPTSSCGSYKVAVQTNGGQKAIYKVAGYSDHDRDSKLYYELSAKIISAKEKHTQVVLKVNNKNEIIAVQ